MHGKNTKPSSMHSLKPRLFSFFWAFLEFQCEGLVFILPIQRCHHVEIFWCNLCNVGQDLPTLVRIELRYLKVALVAPAVTSLLNQSQCNLTFNIDEAVAVVTKLMLIKYKPNNSVTNGFLKSLISQLMKKENEEDKDNSAFQSLKSMYG